MLILTALIWGIAFVAQQVGGEALGAFSFNGIRSFIGGIVLIPVVYFINNGRGGDSSDVPRTEFPDAQGSLITRAPDTQGSLPANTQDAQGSSLANAPDLETGPSAGRNDVAALRSTLIGGIICGSLLFLSSSLQQVGLLYTTVGKSGFITALYIVCVPVLSIFLGKRSGMKVWAAVAIAVIGLYLLCMTDGLSLSRGDTLTILCAFAFSFHILAVDHFCVKADNVFMSCIQFFTCGTLSVLPMVFVEHPQLAQVRVTIVPLLYAGVLSCGVAYTLQIVGQKYVNPAAASIIMSLEAVFSVLAGWILLHQTMSSRELLGCVLMFSASILAQLPGRSEKSRKSADDR